jgi:TolB-like protein
MKMIFLAILVEGLILSSCVTMQDKTLSSEEKEATEVIGSAKIDFISFQIVHIIGKETIKQKAYAKLMEEARSKYQGNIEVKNITIEGSFTPLELLVIYPFFPFGNFQKITATGDVISTSSSGTATRIDRISIQIVDAFKGSQNSSVAILDFNNIDGKQSILGRYFAEQTSNYLFRNSKLKIIERLQINRVISEVNFGMSGYVSDESAIRIGHMLGADAVVLGTMTKIGNRISVNIKIVETETGTLLSSGTTEISGEEYIEMYNQNIKSLVSKIE